MRLLNLPEYVRIRSDRDILSAGHAKALLSLGPPEQMSAAADQIDRQGHERAPDRSFVPQNVQAAEARQGRGCLYPPGACRGGGGALKETTGSEVHVDYKGGKGVLHIAFYMMQLQQFAGLLGHYDPEQAAEAADPSGEGEA